jgi:hypothetical protein
VVLDCLLKVMARCSLLAEAVVGAAEVENMDEAVVAAELERAFGEDCATSDGEKGLASPATEETLSEGGSDGENSRMYYFGSSTITMGKVKEMVEKGYFSEGGARESGAKTMPEPDDNEVVVYGDFFITGLRMPPHPALTNILLHFQVQLHQLMPNAIAPLSKYFWAVGRFRGVPSGNAFAKWYELHYQPKTVETPKGN